MIIQIGINTSDNKVVNKTVDLSSITGELITPCNVMTPTFKLREYYNINYCYIPDFNRFYYVQPPTVVNGYVIYDCNIDVLMTYKDNIKNTVARCIRNENIKDNNIIDPLLPCLDNKQVITLKFGKTFSIASDNNYYINVI